MTDNLEAKLYFSLYKIELDLWYDPLLHNLSITEFVWHMICAKLKRVNISRLFRFKILTNYKFYKWKIKSQDNEK